MTQLPILPASVPSPLLWLRLPYSRGLSEDLSPLLHWRAVEGSGLLREVREVDCQR